MPLAAEIHSRPFLTLGAPESITHFAVFRNADSSPPSSNARWQHVLLAELCAQFGVAPLAQGANHFYQDFVRFRLKWECHTEFATYTFTQHTAAALPLDQAFARMPLKHLPEQWLISLKGHLLVATHVLLERTERERGEVAASFDCNLLVMLGRELWTDFASHADGFSHFVIRDVNMSAQQARPPAAGRD